MSEEKNVSKGSFKEFLQRKDIVFSENSGSKEVITQKTLMPTIQGAIITAEGAKDVSVKTNIIDAVCAVTGLSIDKIQVFEIEK